MIVMQQTDMDMKESVIEVSNVMRSFISEQVIQRKADINLEAERQKGRDNLHAMMVKLFEQRQGD